MGNYISHECTVICWYIWSRSGNPKTDDRNIKCWSSCIIKKSEKMQVKMWQKEKYSIYLIHMAETIGEKPSTSPKSENMIPLLRDTENLKYRANVIGQFRDVLKSSSKKYPYFSSVIVTPELNDPMSLRITTNNNTSIKVILNDDATMPSMLHSIRNDGLVREYGLSMPKYISEIFSIVRVLIRMDNAIYQTAVWSAIPYYSPVDGTFREKDGTVLINFQQEWFSRKDTENIISGFNYILSTNPSIPSRWQKTT